MLLRSASYQTPNQIDGIKREQGLGVIPVTHFYEVRPRKDKRGVDLISDTLPFGHLWYAELNAISNAVGYAKFSRSHKALIRVFDESGTVIEAHEHGGDFQEP